MISPAMGAPTLPGSLLSALSRAACVGREGGCKHAKSEVAVEQCRSWGCVCRRAQPVIPSATHIEACCDHGHPDAQHAIAGRSGAAQGAAAHGRRRPSLPCSVQCFEITLAKPPLHRTFLVAEAALDSSRTSTTRGMPLYSKNTCIEKMETMRCWLERN